MHRIQHDPPDEHNAYGQYGPEEDCFNADHYGGDYVYVYSADRSGYSVAGALDGVCTSGWSTLGEHAAGGDIDLAWRKA